MPTIDIGTQRNSGGIGNAWDFFDVQRVWSVSDRLSLVTGRHTVQAGFEYRRINLKGEYMARTNGDLDYDNWVFFFTGHGAAGGGSDLDQGDTRRDFLANDIGGFVQDDWHVGGGLTVNAGLRYDIYGNFSERNGRIGNYYLPDVAAPRWASSRDFRCLRNAPFFQPDFTPLAIGLVIDPGPDRPEPDSRGEVRIDGEGRPQQHRAAHRPGVAPVVRAEVGRARRLGRVLRADRGQLQEGPAAAAPFFILQNVPAPPDMADPYPRLNVNPFQIPLNVRIARDANGAPTLVARGRHAVPRLLAVQRQEQCLRRPARPHAIPAAVDDERAVRSARGVLLDVGYVGSRGVGLLGKSQPGGAARSARHAGQRLHRHLRPAGRLINPDFFVPAEFLGLNRNGGFQQLTNVGRSTYHSLQAKVRANVGRALIANVAYTLSRSMDTLSSDGGLVEHDPTRPENNFGPSDYDRTHRLTTSFIVNVPALGRDGSVVHAPHRELEPVGDLDLPVGDAVLGARGAHAERLLRAARPAARQLRAGHDRGRAINTGRVQDRLDEYFNVAAFQDSLDQWGNTGRNILRGPSQMQLDLTIGRTLPCAPASASSCGGGSTTPSTRPSSPIRRPRSPPTAPARPGRSRRRSAVHGRCSSRPDSRSERTAMHLREQARSSLRPDRARPCGRLLLSQAPPASEGVTDPA